MTISTRYLKKTSQVMVISFFISGLFASCSTPVAKKLPAPTVEFNKEPAADVKSEKIPYTFEQLQQAAGYVSVVIQREVDAKSSKKKLRKIFSCDPSFEKANVWMMRLKSLIDQTTPIDQADYLARSAKERVTDPKYENCQTTCLCGSYAELISSISPDKRSSGDQQIIEKMQTLQEKQSDLKCAKDTKWFCDSPLHRDLISNE